MLPDKQIIKAAFNVYESHLRGLRNKTEISNNTLKRLKELMIKEIETNSVSIVIKLEV